MPGTAAVRSAGGPCAGCSVRPRHQGATRQGWVVWLVPPRRWGVTVSSGGVRRRLCFDVDGFPGSRWRLVPHSRLLDHFELARRNLIAAGRLLARLGLGFGGFGHGGFGGRWRLRCGGDVHGSEHGAGRGSLSHFGMPTKCHLVGGGGRRYRRQRGTRSGVSSQGVAEAADDWGCCCGRGRESLPAAFRRSEELDGAGVTYSMGPKWLPLPQRNRPGHTPSAPTIGFSSSGWLVCPRSRADKHASWTRQAPRGKRTEVAGYSDRPRAPEPRRLPSRSMALDSV